MNMAERDQLLADFMAGALSEDRQHVLLEELQADADFADRVAELLRIHRLLGLELAGASAEQFAAEVVHMIRPKADASEFARKVVARIRSRPANRRRRWRPMREGAGLSGASIGLAFAATAAAVLLIALVYPRTAPPRASSPPTPAAEVARVDAIEGDVELSRSDPEAGGLARPGDAILSGDRIRTALSRAKLVFGSGTEVLVNRGTSFSIDHSDGAGFIDMEAGEVFVAMGDEDRGFVVRTRHGRTVDMGTRFDVASDSQLTTVIVTEGRVISSTDRGSAEVDAGQEVALMSVSAPPGKVKEANDLERRLAWTKAFDPKTPQVVAKVPKVVPPEPVAPPKQTVEEPPPVAALPVEPPAPVPAPAKPATPPARPQLPEVVGFSLIDPRSRDPIPKGIKIPDRATINSFRLPDRTIIIAANTAPRHVAHVKFVLDNGKYTMVEEFFPYTLGGDTVHKGGGYNTLALKSGWHTLTATPFVKSGDGFLPGKALTIRFRVVAGR